MWATIRCLISRDRGEIGMTTIRVANPEFDDHVCAPGLGCPVSAFANVTELNGFLPKTGKGGCSIVIGLP